MIIKTGGKLWRKHQKAQMELYLQESPFIICDCYTHALHLEFNQDTDHKLYLSMWERSPGYSKMALRERLRLIWRVLTTGRPYTDEIVLDAPKIKLLRDKLDVICKYINKSVKKTDII